MQTYIRSILCLAVQNSGYSDFLSAKEPLPAEMFCKIPWFRYTISLPTYLIQINV